MKPRMFYFCHKYFKCELFFIVILLLVFSQKVVFAYQYNPKDKLDPFMMFQKEHDEIRSTGVKFDQFEAAALTLGGTMIGNKSSAVVLSPDGKDGTVVKVGDKIGKNGGKIVSITRNKVIIRESYKTKNGLERYQDVRLEMARAVKNPRPDQPGIAGIAPAGAFQGAGNSSIQFNNGNAKGANITQQPTASASPLGAASCASSNGQPCVPGAVGGVPGASFSDPALAPDAYSSALPGDPSLQGLTDPQQFGIPSLPQQQGQLPYHPGVQ